ncbi:TetR-like C-terminal domain-containing protein [Cryptosporangium sp. NPDC051539]|uniref:TetR-like C-terminal domain-containing protein n=1 Tax=Cryptosporangium sp. NPDC051539 TaxID=3363962 RepID=UPI0037AF7E35
MKGLDALRQKLSALASEELSEAMATAAVGRSSLEAVMAVADAYRAYAHAHPGRYLTTQRVPAPDDPVHVKAGERAVGTIYGTLRGYGLEGDDAVDATRALRSAMHGFVSLEAAGGFGLPQDVDRSFSQLVKALDTAFRAWPSTDPDDA